MVNLEKNRQCSICGVDFISIDVENECAECVVKLAKLKPKKTTLEIADNVLKYLKYGFFVWLLFSLFIGTSTGFLFTILCAIIALRIIIYIAMWSKRKKSEELPPQDENVRDVN